MAHAAPVLVHCASLALGLPSQHPSAVSPREAGPGSLSQHLSLGLALRGLHRYAKNQMSMQTSSSAAWPGPRQGTGPRSPLGREDEGGRGQPLSWPRLGPEN